MRIFTGLSLGLCVCGCVHPTIAALNSLRRPEPQRGLFVLAVAMDL